MLVEYLLNACRFRGRKPAHIRLSSSPLTDAELPQCFIKAAPDVADLQDLEYCDQLLLQPTSLGEIFRHEGLI